MAAASAGEIHDQVNSLVLVFVSVSMAMHQLLVSVSMFVDQISA